MGAVGYRVWRVVDLSCACAAVQQVAVRVMQCDVQGDAVGLLEVVVGQGRYVDVYFGCACRQGDFAARDGDFLAVDAGGGLGVAVHARVLSFVVPADGRPFDEFPREVVDVHVVADFLRDFPAFAPRVFFAAREVVVCAFGVEGEVVEVFVRAVAAIGLCGFGDHFGQFAERFAAPGVGVEVNARFDAEPLAFGRGVRVVVRAVVAFGGEGGDAFSGVRQGDRDSVVDASGEDFRDADLAEGVEHADDG